MDTCSCVDQEQIESWEWTNVQASQKHEILHFIFHSPCKDGFGAAWAFYRGLIETPPDRPLKVIFTPENHRFEKTKALLQSRTLKDEHVLAVDICPLREMSIALSQKAKSYQVYDHHETAQRDCGDLPYCFFDMKRSGAGIAWDTFNKAPRPYLIDCIEAGDLWKWDSVPYASEVCIVLEVTTRFRLDQWDAFSKRLETEKQKVIEEGKYYHRYREVVTSMLTGRKVHKLTIKGVTMPAVNASIFQSGVGAALVTKIGPCAAVYYWNGQYWAFSLRSSDKGPNVAKIAEKLGGGGHHNAAGFRVDDLAQLRSIGGYFQTYTDDEQDEIERLLDDPDLVEPWIMEAPLVH